MQTSSILITGSCPDYELLDSGEGEKLERFGKYVMSRPDPQALWQKRLAPEIWKNADGHFSREEKKGDWSLKKTVPAKWQISFPSEIPDLKFWVKPTTFKHVGVFPEQAPNWRWISEKVKESGNKNVEVLNLFGYTGGASLALSIAGAKVVHVDGSKAALTWARENAELSGLKDRPIRWILDDAREFVRREVKRGRKYDGIIMDPPSFGHGPEGELWKIEENFVNLFEDTARILADKPLFFLINGYAAGYSAIAYENNLLSLKAKYGGVTEKGELGISEKEYPDKETRVLPCGIFARWAGRWG